MRYILYLFTMILLFVSGMLVGNVYLPDQGASMAAAVSVPGLPDGNPVLQQLNRQTAEKNLEILGSALQSCPAVVNEEKDRLINQIRLQMALEEFELKKVRLELEIAKNKETNRPTSQFIQASTDYNKIREQVQLLADLWFPTTQPEENNSISPDVVEAVAGKTDPK